MIWRWPVSKLPVPWPVDLITVIVHNRSMIKVLKPTDEFDQDLKSKGLMRTQELASVHATDTGKKDAEGNPIFTFGSVYRQKIVPIIDNVTPVRKGKPRMNVEQTVKSTRGNAVYTFNKAPRSGSKLSAAVGIVTRTGKDDKPACIDAIASVMNVTKGNASIYYAKAKSLIEQGL
jgi:hypothetical protein